MTKEVKGKFYVLDTNVLLSDSNAIESFKENNLIIPIAVLEELDKHKTDSDDVGRNARETIRKFSALLKGVEDIKEGVSLGDGRGKVFFMAGDSSITLPEEFSERAADNQILKLCLTLKKGKKEFALVTKDVSLRIKARSIEIPAEDYRKSEIPTSITTLYNGVRTIKGEFNLDEFYSSGSGVTFSEELESSLHPNEFLILEEENSEKTALARFIRKGVPLKKVKDYSPSKVQARNKEQKFALDLLMDPDILLVSLSGTAGCGKSLLSLAAGLSLVLDHKRYETLVICRPMEPLGKEMGFLPGMIEEKIDPWMAPIKDNLKRLLGDTSKKKKGGNEFSTLDYLTEKGIIEIQPMTYIRGRSIPNAFILIDEAQNISPHEMKTIITRAGENTKIVLNGDVEQIDAMHLDSVSNGLSVVIEKFKSIDLAGHVTLVKGERSELASIAARLL